MAKDEKVAAKNKKYVPDHESRHKLPTRVVIRHLPPTMTEEEFLKQTDPLPPYDFYYFAAADWSLGSDATCRAYITFRNYDDILLFRDRFDGYVFVDSKGEEYIAIVEFAPFQHVLRNKSRNGDNKINTIEDDSHYQHFLKRLQEEREAASKGGECKLEFSLDNKKEEIASTPLLVYLANKKEKRREDTRKRAVEKKRQREDEQQQANRPHAHDVNSKTEDSSKSNERVGKMSRNQRRAERNRRRVEEYKKRFGENEPEPFDKTDKDDRKQVRRNRKTKSSPVADNESKKNIEILKKPSVDDMSESVRNFIIQAAQTIHPNSSQEPTTSNRNDNASITNKLNQLEDAISKLELNDKDNNLKKNRHSSNEFHDRSAKQRHSDDKREERRIRNKDRPSIAIYQPKPLLRLSVENENTSTTKDSRGQSTSDCENHKISTTTQQSEPPQRYKKVQRYSERTRNRNKVRNTSIDIKINKEMRA